MYVLAGDNYLTVNGILSTLPIITFPFQRGG
jgi:hypothetical protein